MASHLAFRAGVLTVGMEYVGGGGTVEKEHQWIDD